MTIKINTTITLTKEQVELIVIEYLKQQGTITGEVLRTTSEIVVKSEGYGPGEYNVREFNGMDIVITK
jgi:hypothetical protein